MSWNWIHRAWPVVGVVVGLLLAVVALAHGQYLWTFIGAGIACRLFIYAIRPPRPGDATLPNESQLARYRRQRRQRRR